jgi:hypothetical protein
LQRISRPAHAGASSTRDSGRRKPRGGRTRRKPGTRARLRAARQGAPARASGEMTRRSSFPLPAPAKPAPSLFAELRQAYAHHSRSRSRQSRHLRSLLSSGKPTLIIPAPGAGKAGTFALC